MFDGDSAGLQGAYAAGEMLHTADIDVWVTELPEKTDVAELLLQSGIDGLTTYTKLAKSFERFHSYRILESIPISIIEQFLKERKTI